MESPSGARQDGGTGRGCGSQTDNQNGEETSDACHATCFRSDRSQNRGACHRRECADRSDWERWDRLHEIKVKALTIGATYDEMDPADMKKMATMMPNASYAFCPNGSHMALWDDQAVYFKQLLAFLHSV